jgi:hypothetical protein
MRAPSYVKRFAEALLAARVEPIDLPVARLSIRGRRGVLTTSRLQYSARPWQLLSRELEYTFWLPSGSPIELSMQLYLNVRDHWRLFAYTSTGMVCR